jgi:SAM-dependent methyltransferase
MNGKKILNIGCGNDAYGTDFLDIYPSRKEVVRCDVSNEKLPYKKNSFDEVYSKNLFEHLPNPLHLLSESRRVLKKGGKIMFITDNAGFLLFHIPLRKNNFLQHNSNAPRVGKDDRHYFLFTPLHLRNFAEKCGGFENVSVRYSYYSPRMIISILRPLLGIINRTFLARLLNPHLVLEAYRK